MAAALALAATGAYLALRWPRQPAPQRQSVIDALDAEARRERAAAYWGTSAGGSESSGGDPSSGNPA